MRRHTAIPFLSSINLGEWQELAAIWQLRAKATGPHRLWPDSTTGLPDASQRHLTPRYGVGVVLATKASARVAGAAEHTPRPRAYVNAGVGSFRRRGCAGHGLAVALTVGEQWRLGRHSPTRCPVSFGLGFTPEDHWRPVASAAESCVNGHFCLRLDFTRTVSDKFLEFLFRNNQGPIPTRGTPDVSLSCPDVALAQALIDACSNRKNHLRPPPRARQLPGG